MIQTCRKVPFSNRREARAAKGGDAYGKPYKCPHKSCKGAYHLGKKVPKKENRAYWRARRHMKELMDQIDIIYGVKYAIK